MAHKGFRNGKRIAEVKGASMIVALATSGVQAVRNTTNRYGRGRRRAVPRTPRFGLATDAEVARLAEAAKANRYGHRDATMILVAYRHGLRASELTELAD
jgi:integrase